MAFHHYPPGSAMPSHAHAEPCLSFVLAGSICETVSGREEIGRVGSIAFKPGGVDHSDRFGDLGARMICVRPPPTSRQLPRCGWTWLHGAAAARLTFRLAPEHLWGDRFGRVEELLVHFVEALEGACRDGHERPVPGWLKHTRDQLHASPRSRPSVEALARQAGVHPVYLSRRFRQAYGAPVSDYAQRLRATLAADRIARSDESLTTIAHALGFADQSHFCRIFARQFGIPAGRYRKLVRESAGARPGSGGAVRS